jgi:hypothetical protein
MSNKLPVLASLIIASRIASHTQAKPPEAPTPAPAADPAPGPTDAQARPASEHPVRRTILFAGSLVALAAAAVRLMLRSAA